MLFYVNHDCVLLGSLETISFSVALYNFHVMLCFMWHPIFRHCWGVTEWYQSRGYRELGGLA